MIFVKSNPPGCFKTPRPTQSFEKEYKKEIKNIVKNKNYKRYFNPKKERFEAILKI